MGAARIVILVAAAVAAIGLALVVRQMAANGHRPAPIQVSQQVQIPTTRVLTASHDLPVGTRIAPGDVNWQTFPSGAVNPVWIVDRGPAPPPRPSGPWRRESSGFCRRADFPSAWLTAA